MQRSIATPLPRSAGLGLSGTEVFGRIRAALERADAAQIGLFFITFAIGIYVFSNPSRSGWYNHFVWQAMAFLDGRAAIDWPVNLGGFPRGNDWMQDVYPLRELTGDPSTTGALLPFPPLPAIVLMEPLIFPIAKQLGIIDIHYSMVVVTAMNIGLMAPPIGIGFYLACKIGNVPPDEAIGAIWPYLGALIVGLIVIATVPWISTGIL